MNRGYTVPLLSVLSLCTSSAWADGAGEKPSVSSAADSPAVDAPPGRWSAGLFLGGNFYTDEIELGNSFFADQVPESAFLVGLRGSYLLLPGLAPRTTVNPRVSVEVESKIAFSSTAGSPMRSSAFAPILGWRLHALVDFWASKRFSPFLVAGVGGETLFSKSRFLDSPDTDAAFHTGLGANFALTKRFSLRGDLRVGISAARNNSASPSFETHFGVTYHFGKRKETPRPSPAATTAAPPLNPKGPAADKATKDDPDADGLVGEKDGCPSDAEDIDGFEDTDGCPDLDNDGDGHLDVSDKCPNEPESQNNHQDEDGCPDEVPVPSPDDPKPDDPKPPEPVSFTIPGIEFRTGSARLTAASTTALDTVLLLLQENAAVTIEISGHTDSQGDEGKNKELSLKRAQAVESYLVKNGVEATRIKTIGRGADDPVAPNDTARGRRKNRRIEFRVLE